MSLLELNRRKSREVEVGNVKIGGTNPIVVQSMTDTNTSDIEKTTIQIRDLVSAGSEIVRVTVNDPDAIKAIPYIRENLLNEGINTPIVGDFHFNGHTLLKKFTSEAKYLDKFRINPGNIGKKLKKDKNFSDVIEVASSLGKPIRIGVNWGSLDQELLSEEMDKNKRSENPKTMDQIMCQTVIVSALRSAEFAKDIGMQEDKIIISCKLSNPNLLIKVYEEIAQKCDYPLHLGLTEAGSGDRGVIYSSCAVAPILAKGIGDTLRVSLTTAIGGERRREIEVAKNILQSLGLRNFSPDVTSCPGCGRTDSKDFQNLAGEIDKHIKVMMPKWKSIYPGVEKLKISVMGCVVNGPGESKHADIGISLPGRGENPNAPVYIDGQKKYTLRGEDISQQFKDILGKYISEKYKAI